MSHIYTDKAKFCCRCIVTGVLLHSHRSTLLLLGGYIWHSHRWKTSLCISFSKTVSIHLPMMQQSVFSVYPMKRNLQSPQTVDCTWMCIATSFIISRTYKWPNLYRWALNTDCSVSKWCEQAESGQMSSRPIPGTYGRRRGAVPNTVLWPSHACRGAGAPVLTHISTLIITIKQWGCQAMWKKHLPEQVSMILTPW